MLSEEEVKHIAELARLGLTEEDIVKFQKNLDSILEFVEILKKVDVGGIEPMAQATETKNIWREDEISLDSSKQQFREQFLKNLPENEQGFIKVPPILE